MMTHLSTTAGPNRKIKKVIGMNGDILRPRRIVRSISAIVAGFLVIVVLSTLTDVLLHATGIYPPWFQYMPDRLFLLATAYRSVYAVLGGYSTARLAPDRPVMHALILGLIGVIGNSLGAVAAWNKGPELGPKWYPLVLIATSVPLVWLGARLNHRPTRVT
jgi:hypothetical protein